MGRLPEAWITPPEIRDLRELTRYRQKLAGLRTSCKDQVHAVLAKLGVAVTCSDLFGAWGSSWMDGLRLPQPYAGKVTSLRQLTGELNTEITMLSEVIADLLAGHPGYLVIQRLPGIGPVLAAVIIAEIGDVTRFKTAAHLASWAGLTPKHRESDIKVTRGHATKQGSRLLRFSSALAVSGCVGVAFRRRSRRAGGAVVVPPLRLLSDARAGRGCGARHMDGRGSRCLAGERRRGGSPSAARTGMPARAAGG